MTHERFNEIVEELLKTTHNTLVRKEDEYSLEADRLSTFKKAAAIQHQTNAQALLGMMTKHVVSIYDFVEQGKPITKTLANEKIGDAINYLCLLYAVLEEQGFIDENKKADK